MSMKMKRIYATLALFSTVLIASCSEGKTIIDPPPPPSDNIAIVTKIERSDGLVWMFDYDADNVLTRVWGNSPDWGDWERSYSRNGSNVTILSDGVQYNAFMNSLGQVVSASQMIQPGDEVTEQYTYNKEGYLTDIRTQYSIDSDSNESYRIEWSNGCAVKHYAVSVPEASSLIEYTDIENRINISLTELLWDGIFCSALSADMGLRSAGLGGNADRYLPGKCSYGDDPDYLCTFSYTLNDQGVPVTIQCVANYDSIVDGYTATLTYK